MMLPSLFSLKGKVAVITGGAGLLGLEHAKTIAAAKGIPVLWDINVEGDLLSDAKTKNLLGSQAWIMKVDITDPREVHKAAEKVITHFGHVDILINNAANNPKMEKSSHIEFSRLENFSLAQWESDIQVGLTGAFLCSQVLGTAMAQRGEGVIINVASDLGIIGPDQRLYQKPGKARDQQPVKPVSYSVVKSGMLGLTRYLATYWSDQGVRCNAISPGGIDQGQDDCFVKKLSNLIPLGRMARVGEYQGAILFLCSQASSYMNGANLVIDGGRTCW